MSENKHTVNLTYIFYYSKIALNSVEKTKKKDSRQHGNFIFYIKI